MKIRFIEEKIINELSEQTWRIFKLALSTQQCLGMLTSQQ